MVITLLGEDHRAQGDRRWPSMMIETEGRISRIDCGDYRISDGIPDTLFISNASTSCIGGIEALAINAVRNGRCPVKIVCTKETRETISKVMQTACGLLGAGAQAENFFYFTEPGMQDGFHITIENDGCHIIFDGHVIVWSPGRRSLSVDYGYKNATADYAFVDGHRPAETLKWAETSRIYANGMQNEEPFVKMVLMGTPDNYVHDFSMFEDVNEDDIKVLGKRYIDGKTVKGRSLELSKSSSL